MVETNDISVLIERIEKSNRKQTRIARWQCFFTAVAAISCVAVLVVVMSLLPQINALLSQAEEVVEQVEVVMADVQTVSSQLSQANWDQVVDDLEQVAQEIADADLAGLAEQVTELVETAQVGVEDALKKLNTIDLNALNKGIQDLTSVIEPLAKFVKLF